MFGAVFICAVGPGPIPVSANSVSLPAVVVSTELDGAAGAVTRPWERGVNPEALQEAGVVAPGSQSRIVRVLGRPLSLSLMRADRTGLAVLSVPKRSVISSLPEVAPDAFRSLVERESGCRSVGRVQVVGSRRGTVALASGLACD